MSELRTTEAKRRALALAKLKATDPEDYRECISDLRSDSFLSEKDARRVATKMRNKYVPSVVFQEGLDKTAITALNKSFAEFIEEEEVEDKPMGSKGHSDSEEFEDEEFGEPEYKDFDNKKKKTSSFPFDKSEDTENIGEEDETGISGKGDDVDFDEDINMDNNTDFTDDVPTDDVPGASSGGQLIVEGDDDKLQAVIQFIKETFGEDNVNVDGGMRGDGGEDDFVRLDDDFDPALGGEEDLDDEPSAPLFGKKPTQKPTSFESSEDDSFGDEGQSFEDEDEMGDFELPRKAPSRPMMASQNSGRKANNVMTKQEQAQRSAERKQLLAALNDDNPPKEENWHPGMGEDTSYNGKPFQMKLKYQQEEKRTNKKLEGNNSMREDNNHVPTSKQKIPTVNGDLGMDLTFEKGRKDGSENGNGWGPEDWKIDFDEVVVPSAEGNMFPGTEIPSEIAENSDRMNTVQMVQASKKRTLSCRHAATGQVKSENLLCKICGGEIEICEECFDSGNCPSCNLGGSRRAVKETNLIVSEDGANKAGKNSKDIEYRGSGPFDGTDDKHSGKSNDENETEVKERGAEVYKARVKTAYYCATELIANQAMEPQEMEAFAEQLLSSRMSPRDMMAYKNTVLRTAEATAQRTAALYSGRMERTASVNDAPISFNPSITDPNPRYSGSDGEPMNRIATSLADLPWTIHKANIEDLEDDDNDSYSNRRRSSRRRR